MLNRNKRNISPFSLWSITTALTGLCASLVAAGSIGLFAHPLRTILTWIMLSIGILLAWPNLQVRLIRTKIKIPVILISLFIIFVFSFVLGIPFNQFSVPIVLSSLAFELKDKERTLILSAAIATAILGLFRTAVLSIPFFWVFIDRIAHTIGDIAGFLVGKPFWPGATFAGMDYIVLMAAWYLLWVRHIPINKKKYAVYVYGGLSIIAGHLCYLMIGALIPDLLGSTGKLFPSETLKWYFPALGCLIHLPIAGLMVRWMPTGDVSIDDDDNKKKSQQKESGFKLFMFINRYKKMTISAAVFFTIIFVLITTLYIGDIKLNGKKIVVYEKGFLNWLKPEHGSYGHFSMGMYGMLPEYIKSHGGRCVISPDLSEQDLEDANVLILIYPDHPWEKGHLERIWRFVREGGSLLVMGEHTVLESDGGNRINDVLEPTGIRVRFDSAAYAVGGWLQSYDKLSHPITLGIEDDQNQFGVVIGASLEVQWPARSILIGRWGWTDNGDPGDESMMGNYSYDPGEKLGDIVLAAEQSFEKGRVFVFGDTSSITNGIMVNCHVFVSRLLGYLANGPAPGNLSVYLRAVIGFLLFILIIFLFFVFRTNEWIITVCFVIFIMVLVQGVCISTSYQASNVMPSGFKTSGKKLAYIDSSHQNAFSAESWREDGTMGLALTLIRNGYLALMLPEFDMKRLKNADLFISIAPLRSFSRAEKKAVKKFIEDGGIFICICGFEEREGSASLLSEFDFYIGRPKPEPNMKLPHHFPLPMGHFKSPYLDTGNYIVYVRFHAAWPVFCHAPNVEVLTYGKGDLPVIVLRQFGKGKIVVIGDTGFAMNKNLEHEGGEPFEGLRENAHFWRWFLTYLNDEKIWVPPPPKIEEEPGYTDGEVSQ